jgi:hypothetical protein
MYCTIETLRTMTKKKAKRLDLRRASIASLIY